MSLKQSQSEKKLQEYKRELQHFQQLQHEQKLQEFKRQLQQRKQLNNQIPIADQQILNNRNPQTFEQQIRNGNRFQNLPIPNEHSSQELVIQNVPPSYYIQDQNIFNHQPKVISPQKQKANRSQRHLYSGYRPQEHKNIRFHYSYYHPPRGNSTFNRQQIFRSPQSNNFKSPSFQKQELNQQPSRIYKVQIPPRITTQAYTIQLPQQQLIRFAQNQKQKDDKNQEVQSHAFINTQAGPNLYHQLYTNPQFKEIGQHFQMANADQKKSIISKVWRIMDQYYSVYLFLTYLRYFGYFLFLASETYQITFDDTDCNKLEDVTGLISHHLESYLKDFKSTNAKCLVVLITVIQAFTSVYLNKHFQESLKKKNPNLVVQLWIDLMKILRSYLFLILMTIVLRMQENLNFDDVSSVIGFLIVCMAISVQKLIKLMYFKQVLDPNNQLIMEYIGMLQLEKAQQFNSLIRVRPNKGKQDFTLTRLNGKN